MEILKIHACYNIKMKQLLFSSFLIYLSCNLTTDAYSSKNY